MDDPWYLPPDSPIPATIHVDGRQIRTISKAERAARFCVLEERALHRRRQWLGY